jgi:hypothetical protein
VPKSKADRVKDLPWLVLLQASVVLGKRWSALSAKERARLVSLVRQSRGRVGNLSGKERLELRKLARKLDLRGAGGELLPLMRARRKPR